MTRNNGRDEPKSGTFELRQKLPDTAEVSSDLSYPPDAERELQRFFFLAHQPARGYSSMRVVGREIVRGHLAEDRREINLTVTQRTEPARAIDP